MQKHTLTWTQTSDRNRFFLILVNHNSGEIQMFNGRSIKDFIYVIDMISRNKKITYTLKIEKNISAVAGVINRKDNVLKYINTDGYVPPILYGLSIVAEIPKWKIRNFLIGYFPRTVSILDEIDKDIEEFCTKNYLGIDEVYVTQRSFLLFRKERFYKGINLKISKKRVGEMWNRENILLTGRPAQVLTVTTNKNSVIVVFITIKQ